MAEVRLHRLGDIDAMKRALERRERRAKRKQAHKASAALGKRR